MLLTSANWRELSLLLTLIPISPVLQCQELKSLEWRAEQQPATEPCSADDLAFASAPNQIALASSYGPDVFQRTGWTCESIRSAEFNGARVLQIARPSVIDDGYAYTLIQPRGASSARLIPFSGGGNLFWGSENDWHNRAATNALLQTADKQYLADSDWLAICLAYLTLLGEEPTLTDLHYAPGSTESFKSYTVPGLLREVPAFKIKHLLPTVRCTPSTGNREVRFYYRTEPVEPLKTATFQYMLRDRKIWLASVEVIDYADRNPRTKLSGGRRRSIANHLASAHGLKTVRINR